MLLPQNQVDIVSESFPATFQDIKTLVHPSSVFLSSFWISFIFISLYLTVSFLFSVLSPAPFFIVIQEHSLDNYTCPIFLQSWLNT